MEIDPLLAAVVTGAVTIAGTLLGRVWAAFRSERDANTAISQARVEDWQRIHDARAEDAEKIRKIYGDMRELQSRVVTTDQIQNNLREVMQELVDTIKKD